MKVIKMNKTCIQLQGEVKGAKGLFFRKFLYKMTKK